MAITRAEEQAEERLETAVKDALQGKFRDVEFEFGPHWVSARWPDDEHLEPQMLAYMEAFRAGWIAAYRDRFE